MRARLATLMGLVALASAQVPLFSAHAEAPMCQGREATIVSTGGDEVQGTDGNDVIHASGSISWIYAKQGDDVVCLENGQVFAGPGRDSVQARGGEEHGGIAVWHSEELDIALGGGPDFVGVYFTETGSGTIDAGPGGGRIEVVTDRSVDVDLEDGAVAIDGGSASYVLNGFDDVSATGSRVSVEGNQHANHLTVTRVACELTMKGGRGHDELEIKGNLHELPEFDCEDPRPRLLGQKGNDKLLGRAYDDVLIGGPGRDLAKGSRGSDKCRAEREKNCER